MNTLKEDRDRAQQETLYLKDQLDKLMKESALLRDDLLNNQSSMATTAAPTVLSSPARLPSGIPMIGSSILSELMPTSATSASLREKVESLTGKSLPQPPPPIPGFSMDTSEFANYPSTSTTGTLNNLIDVHPDREREDISPKRSGSYAFGSSVPRFTRAPVPSATSLLCTRVSEQTPRDAFKKKKIRKVGESPLRKGTGTGGGVGTPKARKGSLTPAGGGFSSAIAEELAAARKRTDAVLRMTDPMRTQSPMRR
eukprot:TRINITY_DN22775_c0_g1_i1.p1 TRINITY_DN22775_c0_g1~~TRINITY_DN22775_c0_g1_i1.p1  ORF type:complete len:292 (+),score=60.50 TRINITY_DN22775_c0_g1_i1:112-876(+)